jgi:outer membrane protein assembly factor BamB
VVTVALAACQQFTVDKPPEDPPVPPPVCEWTPPPTETRPFNPLCQPVVPPPGGFRPIVEWGAGRGEGCTSLPAVGDLDQDGVPEIVANFTPILPGRNGDLVLLRGDTGGEVWRRPDILAFGAAVALADVSGDGVAEILAVVRKRAGLVGIGGTYALTAWDRDGNKLWETDEHPTEDFDHAAAIAVSDMDHDGTPEIVVGRAIFRPDGTLRGVGNDGRGSGGIPPIVPVASEGSLPAVADLDLDGVEEVITGSDRYDPDGNNILNLRNQEDGIPAVVNLDADPEGEVVFTSVGTVLAQDTDGRVMWGPVEIQDANIVSPPAAGDIDGDGFPEIIAAGGSQLVALNHDGTLLWEAEVQDLSGATGASLFDFEGDGFPEVVYIDEIQMIAFDGPTGRIKFYSDEHASNTMYDYPIIADVDADDHAEIVVCHNGLGRAISVYGDEDDSWRPARGVWNQHAYTVTNVADDLTIPTSQDKSWQIHNSYHGASGERAGEPVLFDGPVDVSAEILGFCDASCLSSEVELYGRLVNLSQTDVPGGTITMSLYALVDGQRVLVGSQRVTADVAGGTTGGDVTFLVPVDVAVEASGFELVADDLGGGLGGVAECAEANNVATLQGALCLPTDG